MNLKIVLNTYKNPYLNQATQKIFAKIFQPQKIPKFRISHSKKSFLSLEILSTPPGMPAEHISLMPSSCLSLTTLIHARLQTKKLLIMARPIMNFCGWWCLQKCINGGGGGGAYIRFLLACPPIPPPLFPSFLFSTPFDPWATQARNDIIKKIHKNCKLLILISS